MVEYTRTVLTWLSLSCTSKRNIASSHFHFWQNKWFDKKFCTPSISFAGNFFLFLIRPVANSGGHKLKACYTGPILCNHPLLFISEPSKLFSKHEGGGESVIFSINPLGSLDCCSGVTPPPPRHDDGRQFVSRNSFLTVHNVYRTV